MQIVKITPSFAKIHEEYDYKSKASLHAMENIPVYWYGHLSN